MEEIQEDFPEKSKIFKITQILISLNSFPLE